MTDNARVRRVVEEMLDHGRTPEEACGGDPELLCEVRARWRRIQRLDGQLDAMFPSEAPTPRDAARTPPSGIEPPIVDGYEIEGVLGRGGMGVVFRARQLKLNRLVALKTLLAGAYARPEELARFRREADAVAALRHPHIVQIYDVGELASGPYCTLELVAGGNLAQALMRGPWPPRKAAEQIATLACAVQFAHKSGFIHRDLKPANILLTADGIPKISDFGLARLIVAGPELTLTGARVGTPSYMAPEQALGKTSAIGPAVDIYALGAVLYEMLTGRPPLEGESAEDTQRKVIAEDPVPPSRLNSAVARDLETICLKCLQKEPARRYGSAQDLSDDLHRFLDGKPVIARPVGVVERTIKWGRRRPTLAALSAVLVVFLAATIGLGLWLQRAENLRRTDEARREERARLAIETAVDSAYAAARMDRWGDANRFLQDATNHLPEATSEPLARRIDQAQADVEFANQLARIRQTLHVLRAIEGLFIGIPSYEWWADEYAKAFETTAFDINGDVEAAAARIRSLPLSNQIVAALDQWALAAFLTGRSPLHRRLLSVARLANPDPGWSDRLRDPELWGDETGLRRLAKDALAATPAPTARQLAVAGALLRNLGAGDAEIDLLQCAALQRQGDVALHGELAKALAASKRYREAATHLRVVLALTGPSASMEGHLGSALCLAGSAEELEEGIEHLRQAVMHEPKDGVARYNLALGLERAGRSKQARDECRRGIEANPTDPWAHHALGRLLMAEGRWADAVPILEKAVEYRPGDKGALFNLGVALDQIGRLEEALDQFRKIVAIQGTNLGARESAAQSLLKLRRYEEARAEFAEVLRIHDRAKDRTAARLDESVCARSRVGLVEALLGLGRFADAKAAADRALESTHLDEAQRTVVERLEEMARRLVPLESQIDAVIAGSETPAGFATQRALAEWLYEHKRSPAAAARVYEKLLATQSSSAGKLNSRSRMNAGVAAALTGYGIGSDNQTVGAEERAAWRKKALAWLQAERPVRSASRNLAEVIEEARRWQMNEDLLALRTDAALAQLSDTERIGWAKMWTDVGVIAALDPQATLERAHSHVDRKQWTKAAAIYAKLLQDTPTLNGEVWFECAAVQLLAGDRDGYRKSCQYMLDQVGQGQMRSYHVARACTLAPHSVDDADAPAKVSDSELTHHGSYFWAATERGALNVRGKRGRQAVPYLVQSISAAAKPGAAVINWLWLALAHHEFGNDKEARIWLTKAAGWLDQLGDEMPVKSGLLGLHRHNWLEAHILRLEAEAALSPPDQKN